MAPTSSQRSSLGSSQPQPFQAAITKLCKQIDESETNTSEINAEKIVDTLRGFLKEYRQSHKILDAAFINTVFPSLENDGRNVCRRLDPTIFCVVLEIATQSEACVDGERTLFLLAQSLFDNANDLESKALLEKRKNVIGKGCLQHLLRYFLDNEVAPTMRRWAGVLCIQLFQDSEENCSWLEVGPDEFRQAIGRLVMKESDEILRMIYAQLVRTLHKADIPLRDLFPTEYSEEVYAGFPPATREEFGWGGSFQAYLDNLFLKNIVEIPESVGNLYLGSSITVLPERTFGVPGHNVYIFVQQEELSILSPAQLDFFDQILDIPLRSIKSMAIIRDAYSQVAADIGIELRSGKGHDIFLDSKRLQLDKIYVTCLPSHVDQFKDELIGSCPNMDVIELDKSSARNLIRSDDRNSTAPQSSVTEEIIGGSQAARYPIEKSSPKSPRVAQWNTNSITETQEKDNLDGKSFVAEVELRNSVDAVDRNSQVDNQLHGTTLQSIQTASEDTPAQNVTGVIPKVPARARKGVKPKAKAPIVPRDLRGNVNQQAFEDSAPKTLTRAKQKQRESGDNRQREPTSQEAKGKLKQSEQVTNARKGSTSQPKKASGVNTEAKPSKRTTRSSQVTKNIEDSDAPNKANIRSNGAPKASVVSPNATASSLRHVPAQSADTKNNEFRVKETEQISQDRKYQEYEQFSDDFITTPDEMDASTPFACKKKPAKSSNEAKAERTSNKLAMITNQKEKRYSLNLGLKPTPIANDMYDIPVDNDDYNDRSHPKTRAKKLINTRQSAPKGTVSTKAASKTRTQGTKAQMKKRQSASAALDRPVATRNNQRNVAAKAKEQLHGAHKSEVENLDFVEPGALPNPDTTQRDKNNVGRDVIKTKVTSKKEAGEKAMSAAEQAEPVSQLLQQDELPTSLARENSVKSINRIADDLYDSTPKLRSKEYVTQVMPKSADNLNTADFPSAPEPIKANPTEDFSSKLGNLIGGLSDDQEQTQPRSTTAGKDLENSVEPIKRKPRKESYGSVSTIKNAVEPAIHKSVGGKDREKGSTVKIQEVSDSLSLQTEEQEQSDASPAPVIVAEPEQKTTPLLGKTPGSDEKKFRKPEVPARRRNSSNQLENGEASIFDNKSIGSVVEKEPKHTLASSQTNDDVHIEAAHGILIDSVSTFSDVSKARRKRKAGLDTTTPLKKNRINASQNHAKTSSPFSSLPSGPTSIAEPDPKQPRKSWHSIEKLSATQRSPWPMDRARKAMGLLHQATADESPVGKDLDRKPHLISFSGKGALNQGVVSGTKFREDRALGKKVPEEASKPRREEVEERKRKLGRVDVVDHESPPNKRQSTSPLGSIVADEYEDGDLPALQQSPVVVTINTKSTHTRRSTRPPTRPSSQTSRVDKNGSPIASSQEDHFEKLRERLAEDRRGNELQVSECASVQLLAAVQQRRLSEVFGPKVVLEVKSKGCLSSPKETASRYIAHEKTRNGIYHEVATKEVINPEKKLQDPFNEQARKSSRFTERLMGGSLTEKHAAVSTVTSENVSKNYKAQPQGEDPTLPSSIGGVLQTIRPAELTGGPQQVDRREQTNVEVEYQHSYNQSMPSDMTTGTSYDSHSSGPSRMHLSEGPTANDIWNVAIRPPPHYANLHEAVHRIADELIIRLADEEQRMGLLVEQYKHEGGKILGKLEQEHKNQWATVMQALGHKKSAMVSIYSEGRELVLETASDLKENSTSQFERKWRKRQDVIRAGISEGRQAFGS